MPAIVTSSGTRRKLYEATPIFRPRHGSPACPVAGRVAGFSSSPPPGSAPRAATPTKGSTAAAATPARRIDRREGDDDEDDCMWVPLSHVGWGRAHARGPLNPPPAT